MNSKFYQSASFVKQNPTTHNTVAIHQMKSDTTGMVMYNICVYEQQGDVNRQIVNELWGDNNEAMDQFTDLTSQYECTVDLD